MKKNYYDRMNKNMLALALDPRATVYAGSYNDGRINYNIVTDGVTAYACPDYLCRVRVDGLREVDFARLLPPDIHAGDRVPLDLPREFGTGRGSWIGYMVSDTLAIDKSRLSGFGPDVIITRAGHNYGMYLVWTPDGFAGVVMARRVPVAA